MQNVINTPQLPGLFANIGFQFMAGVGVKGKPDNSQTVVNNLIASGFTPLVVIKDPENELFKNTLNGLPEGTDIVLNCVIIASIHHFTIEA